MAIIIYPEDMSYTAEQGSHVKIQLDVKDVEFDDIIDVIAPEGVAHELSSTYELTLSSNTPGVYDVFIAINDETPEAAIIFEVKPIQQEEAANDAPVEEVPAEEPPPPVVEEPVVETPPPAPKSTVAKPVTDPDKQEVLTTLEAYKARMTLSGMCSVEDGCRQQYNLNRLYTRIFSKPQLTFNKCMDTLIQFVRENRTDCFNERGINRFIGQVKMNKDEIQFFTRFNTMLLVVADLNDKKMISKRVDLKHIESKMSNGANMQKLYNYFNPTGE